MHAIDNFLGDVASLDAADGGMMSNMGFMGFGLLLWIILIVLIIIAVSILVSRTTSPHYATHPSIYELQEEIRMLRRELRELKEKHYSK